ncbi:cytochrome oxidase complex assembly protein 1-domain-containing protein [Peziza echinospora]|nr:cytochrome oxidase complex assembly protein 1-domain-containing protein [Peziza echinospora]
MSFLTTTASITSRHLRLHKPTSPAINLLLLRRTNYTSTTHNAQTIHLATPTTQPILTRRTNRPLPPLHPPLYQRPLLHIPIFLLLTLGSTLFIFNYQNLTSPIITSTLYTLRTSPLARETLGDEIQLGGRPVTWVYGSMDQFHGKVDISYYVKGRKGGGWVEFGCEREGGRQGLFRTVKWRLRVKRDGREEVVDLLEEKEGAVPVVE